MWCERLPQVTLALLIPHTDEYLERVPMATTLGAPLQLTLHATPLAHVPRTAGH